MYKKLKRAINRSLILLILATILSIFMLIIFLLLFFYKDEMANNYGPIIGIYVILFCSILTIILFIFIARKQMMKKERTIASGVNYYFEKLISSFSIGLIIFHPNGNVLWVSDFIEERFGKKIVNENILFFNPDINLEKKFIDFQKILKKGEYIYKINLISKEMIMIVQDITQEYSATHFYEIEKLVIGEVEIDNYQLFASSFSDEEMFNINVVIKNLFDNLTKKYNLIYKQYTEGKYMLLTNRDNLNKMIASEFKDLEQINTLQIDNARISLSIGFGADTSNYSMLMEMAKEALVQSQTRGGDQITVISSIEKTKRFGSKSEISVLKSRTKIKNVANNLKIKLQDPKIKNVVIYGHKFADLDAIGASYAVYEVAKYYKKNAYIQNQTFDDTAQKALKKYLTNTNEVFVNPSKIKNLDSQETLIVIVDCAEETRVENPNVFIKAKGDNVFIFDHHRVSKLDDIIQNLNIYVETSASSACEIITEMIKFNEFDKCLSRTAIQMLLNGIYLDTNQFKKAVSSRTFAAASILEDWGAEVEEATSLLKISSEANEQIINIVSKSKEIKPGYWLSYTNEIIPIDVISMGADEILKIEDRKAAFVVAQLPKKNASDNPVYKLSARSIGVNVQLIAEAVGGGGHFNAAAAISDSQNNESLQTFVDNIAQAIISSKDKGED